MSCAPICSRVNRHGEPSAASTLCVVGVGVVGGALASSLMAVGHDVLRHDPAKGENAGARFGDVQAFFVCVPTPHALPYGVDLAMVREALAGLPPGVPVVLRSTVLPGTTDALQGEFPDHLLLHAPEFLTEDQAEHDEMYPARKIVGYTETSKPWAESVLMMLPTAPYERMVPAKAAEMIKYFANVFYATTVSYVNQIYDLCQKVGIDYEYVRDAASADPMMSSSHLEPWHKGYRGYGGKCLPKDTQALLTLAARECIDLGVVEAARRYNDRLVNHGAEANRESHHPACGPCAGD
jgi:UDPglucose 6-dehydrogenase